VALHDEAMAAADEADKALVRGDAVGSMHGVPATTKINFDQKGCPTDGGVVEYKSLMASRDNPVIANMHASGMIIVGRTNAPAFSLRWFTDNELHGLTLNPWNKDRTCGGSSGGAASATAAGIGAIALGSDIAGSLRFPAYCCGLVGLRPTYGRIPWFNFTSAGKQKVSSALMSVPGPLTRTVRRPDAPRPAPRWPPSPAGPRPSPAPRRRCDPPPRGGPLPRLTGLALRPLPNLLRLDPRGLRLRRTRLRSGSRPTGITSASPS
jgi:amidase